MMNVTGSTNSLKSLGSKPQKYEVGMADENDKPKEDEDEGASESEAAGDPGDESGAPAPEGPPDTDGPPPPDDGSGMGDPNADPMGAMGPPPGYDEWLANFEHAMQTHPVLYGMVQKYAQDMQAQQGQPAGDPGADPAAAAAAPPGDGMEVQGAPPGGDPGMGADPSMAGGAGDAGGGDQELAAMLSGGAGEMPRPDGEAPPDGDPTVNQYGLGNSFDKLTGASLGSVGGTTLGAGAGLLASAASGGKIDPIDGLGIGAGIGGGAGTLGGLAMSQNEDAPVIYAALNAFNQKLGALDAELRTVKTVRDKDKAEIARLTKKSAESEAQVLMYQMGKAGVTALVDQKKSKKLFQTLVSLPEAERKTFAADVIENWSKDDSVAYAAAGAPIGDFIAISEQGAQNSSKPKKFGDDPKHMPTALAELRKGKKNWDECMAYAMNGEVVTG